MKKVLITLTFVLALALQPVMAYAETTEPSTPQPVQAVVGAPAATTEIPPVLDANGQPVNPGTPPDSNLYWLSNLIQKLQVALTFDPVKKATLEENQALQKLATARELIQKGEPELAQKSLNEYSQKIQNAQQFLEKLKDPNSTSFESLQKAMAQTDASNIQVLSRLLEKLPPEAAEKLAVNIVKSMEKAVDKMTDEQKKEVKVHLQETAKHISQGNPDAQVAEALAKFQTSLGLKSSADAKDQKGDHNGANKDNDGDNEDNDGDNTILANEDPNQPVRTIAEEKKAAALKQNKTKEQENEDSSKEQISPVVPAPATTLKPPATSSPTSIERAATGRDNGGKGDKKVHNENQNKD